MRELMLKVEYLERSSICIGRVGESNSTRIKIDAVYWRNKFSNISFEAVYRRADGVSYPVKISTDKNYIIWDIKRKDLYKAGTAYLKLVGYELGKKVISTTAICFVNPGINGITIDSDYTEDQTPIDWIQNVLDEVGDLKNSVYAEIEHAISSAGHLKREIVDELPELDVADKDTIYMIKRVDGNDYIEYIIIENEGIKRFEKLGDTKVDLSGYVQKIVPESSGNVVGISTDGSLIDTKIKPQDIIGHINNTQIHVSEEEKNIWNTAAESAGLLSNVSEEDIDKLKDLPSIKSIGTGLLLNEETGELISTGVTSLPIATPTTLGGIKQGDGILINNDGSATIKVNEESSNGLIVTSGGIGLTLASPTNAGAITQGLFTKITGIEAGAQANLIEEIRINNNPLPIKNKSVTIPIAGDGVLGLVKSSNDANTILVDRLTGTMYVNKISTSKLYTPEGENFVLNAGNSKK